LGDLIKPATGLSSNASTVNFAFAYAFAISRQSFAHLRHCSAHSLHDLSLACFSHSAAHLSQASAQAFAIMADMGPFRDDMLEQALQMSAQSKHNRTHSFIAGFPAASSLRHSATQAKQLALQSAHPE
jgi:hypothetical protein